MKLEATKKPTGLSITRKKMKFVCEWKINDADYKDGQWFEKDLSWVELVTKQESANGLPVSFTTSVAKSSSSQSKVGSKVTKEVIELNASEYYPTTRKRLKRVKFGVRGDRAKFKYRDKKNKEHTYDPAPSGWAYCTFDVKAPAKPKVTKAWDSSASYTATFTAEASESDHAPFTRLQWQTMRITNASSTDGKQYAWGSSMPGWSTGTQEAFSKSVTIVEAITPTNDTSYTRFIRFRAQGVGGESDWVYAYHVYGRPYKPTAVNPRIDLASGNVTIDVRFNTPQNASHPITAGGITLKYAIDTPIAGLECPVNPTWESTPSRSNTKVENSDRFFYEVGRALDYDECLWYKLNVKYDNEERDSDVYLRFIGKLSTPDINTLTANWETRKLTVDADNNSAVPDSRLVVICADRIIGMSTTGNGNKQFILDIPEDVPESAAFGIYAAVGEVSGTTIVPYEGKKYVMKSATVWQDLDLPVAPSNVQAVKAEVEESVLLTWENTWSSADSAQISWSDNPLAWESNDEPQTYDVSVANPEHWYISGLEEGVRWYFRIRMSKTVDDVTTYSAWSDVVEVDLRSAPNKPTLELSDYVITENGMTQAYWAYVTTDGTPQSRAELCEASIVNGELVYGDAFAKTDTAQHIDISAADQGWQEGETHLICVRVRSESGVNSEGWSDPVSLVIAANMSAEIYSDSLVEVDLDEETSGELEGTENRLTTLPLTVEIHGAGAGLTTVAVERLEDYQMDRPDETQTTGYAGETVALKSQYGEAEISIDAGDLIGHLDDGAQYRLVATVADEYGQSAEVSKDFVVRWAHQAVLPNGAVSIDGTVAVIIPGFPEDTPIGWTLQEGDSVDIYRLSADRPELLFPNAEFGTAYVDPYPAIGGGYRIVFKTKDGDYIIDADGENGVRKAWVDVDSGFVHDKMLIDFGGETAELYYNVDEDDSWSKDFRATRYLGGSIVGDWNSGVDRSAEVSAVVITVLEEDTVDVLRRLAEYEGAVHVRTVSGGSYVANVDVKRTRSHEHFGTRYSYGINITKIDSQGYDGMKWIDYVTSMGYILDENGQRIVDENGAYLVGREE